MACVKPNICRVRLRSQISESNGESSVTRWRPRRPADSPASAAGSAQPGVMTGGALDRHRGQPGRHRGVGQQRGVLDA